MQSQLGIVGLGLSFSGAALLAVNAYASNLDVWIEGTMTDRLRKPIVAIIGFVIITIGFGLQLYALLLYSN